MTKSCCMENEKDSGVMNILKLEGLAGNITLIVNLKLFQKSGRMDLSLTIGVQSLLV